MKNTKYWWVLLLVFVLLIASACGGEDPEKEEEAAAQDQTATELLERGQDISAMSYDLYMTGPDHEISAKVWIKDNNFRMEFEEEGEAFVFILNAVEEKAYSYIPAENLAYTVPWEADYLDTPETPADFIMDTDEDLLEMGERVVYEGIHCRKIHVQADPQMTMWVHEEYGLPIKVEISDQGEIITMEYRNIEIGNIADEVFAIPEDAIILG